jgi:hypothetical protein
VSERHNVFISWSGKRSKSAAQSLYDWLPLVLQSVRPWMSEEDIQKGSRGLDEIGRALEGIKIGVICLAPENLTAPWILYEAGALSKTLDAKTRVCRAPQASFLSLFPAYGLIASSSSPREPRSTTPPAGCPTVRGPEGYPEIQKQDT